MYGVPKLQVKWVEKRIHELDERLCTETGYVLLPLVRDAETTRKHSPNFLREWTTSAPQVFNATADLGIGDPALESFGPRLVRGRWRPQSSAGASCNDEMALAA